MTGSGTGEGVEPSGRSGLDRSILLVAGVVIIGALMSILDATIVNVALDTLSRKLHSSLTTIQWVVSGYTLALASIIPISGWAADRFGAKRVWLYAIAVFTVGSVLCGFAWSAGSLIAFRVIEGFGGGILTPVGTTMIARAAGPKRMGQVMSLMGVPLLLGPVLGPILGGVLIQAASWRWIFFINAPIGAFALIVGTRLLPADGELSNQRLDVRGLLLLSPGIAGLVFGISSVHTLHDISSAKVLISVIGGVVLIVAFVLRSLHHDSPLLDIRLFRNRTFASGSITTFALGMATFGAAILLPLYFQQVRGEGVLDSGLLTASQAGGMAISMSLSGSLADRIGAGWVVPGGLLFTIAATFGLTTIGSTTSLVEIDVFLFILGIGLGASMMPTMSAAYATLSADKVSGATTELQIVQRVGSSIGSALFVVVLAQRLAHSAPAAGASRAAVAHAAGGAYAGAFWWGVVLSALALIPAFALPRNALPRMHMRGHGNPLAGNTDVETAPLVT